MESLQSREDTYLCNITQLSALIDYINRAGLNALDEYQKDKMLNLTARQTLMMTTVQRMSRQEGEGVTLSNLAHELHMSISAASHLVDTLEAHHLLQRSNGTTDRRNVRLIDTLYSLA